jgi:putative addiction module component (TIGR02574 family)
MSRNLEALEAQVMTLSPVDRTHLLERLIMSLDEDAEVEAEWRAEAERRESELASGSVAPVAGEEAMSRLRARLNR